MGRDSQVLRETDREFQASLPGSRHAEQQTQAASYIAHKSSKKRKRNPATARVVKSHGVLSTTTQHLSGKS